MKFKSNPSLTLLSIVFGLLFFYYFFENKALFLTALFVSGAGVFSFNLSIIIEKIWFKISYILSQILPNILLTLIFFLILTPIALLSKLFDSQTNFNLKKNQKTTFLVKNKSFSKRRFERAW